VHPSDVKISSAVIFGAATLLLVTAVAVAEHALRSSTEIPGPLFFGIPVAGAVIALSSIYRSKAPPSATPARRRRTQLYLGIAVVLAILPMLLLTDRYRADHDSLRGRTAPDGSPVTSISWSEQGGRYVERLNDRFETELTEAQYREIMRDHQRAFFGALVMFASLAFWTSLASMILDRRKR
jgi:cobalamin synthase